MMQFRLLVRTLLAWCIASLTVAIIVDGAPTAVSLAGLFVISRTGVAYDFANPQTNISVFDCSKTNSCSFTGQSDRYSCFRHQLDRINADPTILPNTTLTLDAVDDQGTLSNGFFKAYELLARKSVVLVGPNTSGASANAALIATGYATPQLSFSASSPILSNKALYPYFMRVCQNDAAQGSAMAWFAAKKFGWKRVALLYTTDAYGSGGSAKFIEAAALYNISIISDQGIPLLVTSDDLETPLRRIRASGATTAIYFGQPAEWNSVLMKLDELQMWTNETAWFACDTVLPAMTDSSTLAMRKLGRSLLVLTPDAGFGTPKYEEFFDSFAARNISGQSPMLQYTPPASRQLNFYAVFAADVVNVIASALHSLLYTQAKPNFTQAELFTSLKAVDIVGLSGRIAFDKNYDRIGTRYILNNLQGDLQWKRLGVYADEVYTPYSGAGEIIWRDGTTNIPRSDPLPTPPTPPASSHLTSASTDGLIIVSVIVLALILMNLIGVIVKRKSRVIHASSPVMLCMLLIGGALVIISVLIGSLEQTIDRCTAKRWLFNIGFQMSFSSMLLKTWRLHRIFNAKFLRITSLTDTFLLGAMSVFVTFDLIILGILTGIAPYTLDEHDVCTFKDGSQSDAAHALTLILVITKGMSILAAAYLSYVVRNLPQIYNESSWLAVAIYNTLLIGAAWIGVRYGFDMTDHPDTLTTFECAIMLASTILTLTLVFAPKWKDVWAAEKLLRHNFAQLRKRGGVAGGNATSKQKLGGGNSGPQQAASVVGGSQLSSSLSHQTTTGQPHDTADRVGTKESGIQTLSEIQSLFADALADQQKALESAFRVIESSIARTAATKIELTKITETIFQIQSEQDYFDQVGKGMSNNEVVSLFRARLYENGALTDSVTSGSDLNANHGGASGMTMAKGSAAVGVSATVKVKGGASSMSNAYAIVKSHMERNTKGGNNNNNNSSGPSAAANGGSGGSVLDASSPKLQIPASSPKRSGSIGKSSLIAPTQLHIKTASKDMSTGSISGHVGAPSPSAAACMERSSTTPVPVAPIEVDSIAVEANQEGASLELASSPVPTVAAAVVSPPPSLLISTQSNKPALPNKQRQPNRKPSPNNAQPTQDDQD